NITLIIRTRYFSDIIIIMLNVLGFITWFMLFKMHFQDLINDNDDNNNENSHLITDHSITHFTINVNDTNVFIPENEVCSICLDKYEENNPGIKLECVHIFHKKCIIEWLNNNGTCPLCRQNVI